MFEKLQKKWKVSPVRLALILSTFAIGGTFTGYAGKKILNLLHISQDWLWVIVYIVLITILWPLSVLLVSIPFGQFRFFRAYLRKLGRKIGLLRYGSPQG
ncbi:MAG TPA: DUF6787 family protein [Chitinophagaceae bacterium]|nr:DUF6787 family protein [Chitinophagaceae bacterium]